MALVGWKPRQNVEIESCHFQVIQFYIKILILQKNALLRSWLRSIVERKENVLLFFHFLSGLEMRRRPTEMPQ